MKKVNRSPRQTGFFDLGMSLFIVALAGGVVYGVESAHQDQAVVEQSVATAQPVQADSKATAKAETGIVQQ